MSHGESFTCPTNVPRRKGLATIVETLRSGRLLGTYPRVSYVMISVFYTFAVFLLSPLWSKQTFARERLLSDFATEDHGDYIIYQGQLVRCMSLM
jgi:hypothetical protein